MTVLTPAYQLSDRPMKRAASDLGCTLHVPHIPAHGWEYDPDPAVILVVNNSTETRWCQALLGQSLGWCFPLGRLQWKSTLQGQLVLYFGPDPVAFGSRFASFGVVIAAHRLFYERQTQAALW